MVIGLFLLEFLMTYQLMFCLSVYVPWVNNHGQQDQVKELKRKKSRVSTEGVETEDYVRVKARRGEATDNHSLAERVHTHTHTLFYMNVLLNGFTILRIFGWFFAGKKSENPYENEALAISCSWM